MISWVVLTAGLVYGQDQTYSNLMKNYKGDKSQGGSNAGDYQQYMKKYAGGSQGGDYQQYMQKYAGGSQGGDYKQYYQKYMDKYGSQGGSQSGDYSQYMEKYAEKKNGDEEQYMDKYIGGQSQSGKYQQYMNKYAAGQGGGYQQYMKKYAGGQDAASATEAQPLELLEESPKKDAGSAVGSELNLAANSNSNYQKYMSQYAGGQGGQGSYQKYMDQYAGKYAGSYEKYMNYQTFMKRYQNEHGKEIGSASDANTTTQLNEWYSGAKNSVQWYVPDDYSSYATHDIDKQYQKRLSEIGGGKGSSSSGPFLSELQHKDKSPFVDTAVNLQEKPQTNKAASVFLAQTANLQLLADQVKSDPAPCAAMALVGVAFAFIVFFAIRRQRSIQTPEIMLG